MTEVEVLGHFRCLNHPTCKGCPLMGGGLSDLKLKPWLKAITVLAWGIAPGLMLGNNISNK